MATIAEQLRTGLARIHDEANWHKGSWAKGDGNLFPANAEELLSIHQVCAVTALAQASVSTGDLGLDYVHEIEHTCDDIGDPYCAVDAEGICHTPDVVEEAWSLDILMEGLSWPALEYLELAAGDLYDTGPMDVNDLPQYTHADVVKVYERAILLAEADGV